MSTDLLHKLQASLGAEYLLERELGGGGMSRVFLAEERRLGRRVVVKVLSPDVAPGFSADRFAREIGLAARLQDPRIVPLLRAGQIDDLPYYTMPYVDGESLRTRLVRGPVPVHEALGILRDVALALEYAHANSVVHRDIKPENILLSGRTAVVSDFGIAKAITAATLPLDGPAGLTALGTIIGTPAYMAPEQAAGGMVDARADIYAWGMVAYEMLAGTHPFAEHTTLQALLTAQMVDAPEPLARRRAGLSAEFTSLVDQCLAKDPNDRPASASALIERLTAAERGVVAPAPAPALARRKLAALAAAVVLLAAAGGWTYVRSERRHWAREVALPQAEQFLAADRPLAAFQLMTRAAEYLPGDTGIARAMQDNTTRVTVTSSPAGARVAIRDYNAPDSVWYTLGTTPIHAARIPKGTFRWKVSAPGARDYVAAPVSAPAMTFALDSSNAAPAGMARVPATVWGDYIAFVGWVGPFNMPAFFIDRFEVTNRQYQAFVDAGGYTKATYWTAPFVRDGKALTWQQAMALFRDRTGRPGPSTWEAGHYPDGQADYPVSGVSWYEASAYAAFAGKSLPAFAQWYEAAPGASAREVVRASNISRSAPAPVGAFKGVGPYGTYDMAGNVREWTLNTLDGERRFILGGSWSSPTYLYTEPELLSPFDRSPANGIRCVRNVAPVPAAAAASVKTLSRDFSTVHPASDAVFRAYRVMYRYDQTALNARDEGVVADTRDWTEEKVSYDAAYGNERVTAYLFLPKRVRPPYQTVLFFPSARVLDLSDSHQLGDTAFFDYVVQSGRAVLYPIYQDTYERRLRHTRPGTAAAAAVDVQQSKDVGRSLDYLATRPDIAGDKLAYLGVSMGAANGVIYATMAQDRLKAIVFLDGGFFLDAPPPGADQVDFAPRLTKPVLMVNGRYDFSFSPAQSQDPLFRMLGTPAADKRHVLLETPHDVDADRPALVAAVLGWLDRYLGPVQ
ncbi:MAG TPA: SUMF1/EgtB/PvdO family nonheme iron enzyme [Gemmatimonadaceae bacterium]|nr:SUMF1/EgtB/PvdO family nonheme iron enzyme [Gemmatimonadaceae bacterium]